jgi:hypothetical protein
MRDDLRKGPAFELGKRTRLDDADAVTDLALVGFVMHVVFFGALDDLVELGMRNAGDVLDDEGLVHFVGNDHANAGFTEVDLCVRRSLAHIWNCLGVDGLD